MGEQGLLPAVSGQTGAGWVRGPSGGVCPPSHPTPRRCLPRLRFLWLVLLVLSPVAPPAAQGRGFQRHWFCRTSLLTSRWSCAPLSTGGGGLGFTASRPQKTPRFCPLGTVFSLLHALARLGLDPPHGAPCPRSEVWVALAAGPVLSGRRPHEGRPAANASPWHQVSVR